ncbi:ABC transporter permease [Paenirhodobacter sp.]|uniref:ABC transporter permease n=1 Tax=Paenirhodobacter sp. TaxID=1965326 RepID=UPI003B42656B
MSSSDHLAADTADGGISVRQVVESDARGWLWASAALLGWAALAAVSYGLPDKVQGFAEPLFARQTSIGFALWALALILVAGLSLFRPRVRRRFLRFAPWLTVLAFVFIVWEVVTAKTGFLPVPFFMPPNSLVEVYALDHERLLDSLLNSMRLLAWGFFIGAATGFLTGVSIGWSQSLGYWVHPVLRFLGPVPSTALMPISFYFFPSSFSAAVFLIALATWFPVTVLSWSGVAGVDKAYYDVARTLGASQRALILRVAVPAALPHVFVGLFMGLSASFSVLVAAEMMGVKSGLGWYLQWAQGWAAYNNMYGALIVMALVFSGLITLLFAVRDRLLAWQKGVVKW